MNGSRNNRNLARVENGDVVRNANGDSGRAFSLP